MFHCCVDTGGTSADDSEYGLGYSYLCPFYSHSVPMFRFISKCIFLVILLTLVLFFGPVAAPSTARTAGVNYLHRLSLGLGSPCLMNSFGPNMLAIIAAKRKVLRMMIRMVIIIALLRFWWSLSVIRELLLSKNKSFQKVWCVEPRPKPSSRNLYIQSVCDLLTRKQTELESQDLTTRQETLISLQTDIERSTMSFNENSI